MHTVDENIDKLNRRITYIDANDNAKFSLLTADFKNLKDFVEAKGDFHSQIISAVGTVRDLL